MSLQPMKPHDYCLMMLVGCRRRIITHSHIRALFHKVMTRACMYSMNARAVEDLASADARPPSGAIHGRQQALQHVANGQFVHPYPFKCAASGFHTEDGGTGGEAI